MESRISTRFLRFFSYLDKKLNCDKKCQKKTFFVTFFLIKLLRWATITRSLLPRNIFPNTLCFSVPTFFIVFS